MDSLTSGMITAPQSTLNRSIKNTKICDTSVDCGSDITEKEF